MIRNLIKVAVSVFLAISLLSSGISYAQADRGTITGLVTDISGAVLPKVSITATQSGTEANFTSVTNNSGIYSIAGLPIGEYRVTMSHPGFQDAQSSVQLIATQVQSLNVKMVIGAATQTISVSSAPQLLETQTSTVSSTMEEEAIRDLPLNATNGRDAVQLMVGTTPSMAKSNVDGAQVYSTLYFAGAPSWTNTVYVDGVDAAAGPQGAIATPGLDAVQEMQVQTANADAELGATGGGVLMFELKSGTNKIHGSAFEFLQNEALNANTWSGNYFLSQCSSTDTTCIHNNSRPKDRFNDYGGSLGGPVWKNHTFLFGDYEYYSQLNNTLNQNSTTVPTAKMLTGDFSELLTGGARQGNIPNPSTGLAWINPCTNLPYQYGQIFDPQTQQVVNGQTCASPFQGNIIPSGRLSAKAQGIAALYTQYYAPTLTSRIYNNYPTVVSTTPSKTKRSFDIKMDQNFSTNHHLSASFDYVKWISVIGGGLVSSSSNPGPLTSEWSDNTPNFMARVIDNYAFSPNVLNTFAVGYSSTQYTQIPTYKISSASQYGFNADGKAFPSIGYSGANGVGEASVGTTVYAYQNYYGYHFQDTVAWQKGNHSLKFGSYVYLQGLNSTAGGNIQSYGFSNQTGGPTDTSLTPWVGNGFASMMLGNVQSASQAVSYPTYPRQKYLTMFAQDDVKVNHRLTLNLGLTWDFTFAGHQQGGHWTNFDLQAQNPLWGDYGGAWTFAKNSGSTFQTDNTFRQFAPHVGGAYQLTDKLVARASYGLYYVPLGEMNSGFGYGFPSQQGEFWTGTNTVPNSIPGSIAFNWDQGYPGTTQMLERSITQTSFGYDQPFYISPKTLHLGRTQNFYAGVQYSLRDGLLWDVRYMGTKGSGLHDSPESVGINYPDFATYSQLLTSGHINDTISDAADAAAAGVPYPYAGFKGPAYAAIAPIPQAAAYNNTIVLETDQQIGVSSYNAFVAEMKARNTHGLSADLSYTLSRLTGSNLTDRDSAANGLYGYQSGSDIAASRGWVQATDQTNLAEGYVTYRLPLGQGQRWLSGSRPVNAAAGGWTIGAFGSYGSGSPIGTVTSPVQYPFFYNRQRDNFANGATANNMKNHFHGKVDLGNLNDPNNRDFDPTLFSTPTLGTLGNSPHTYDHWRWNSGAAHENLSLTKAFSFGENDRFKASVRGEFYNVFNRHYVNGPDTNPNDPTFGQITGVASAPRTGQLGARIQW
jgi:hypothetical protein